VDPSVRSKPAWRLWALGLPLLFVSLTAFASPAPPVGWKGFGCAVEARGVKPMRLELFWFIGTRDLTLYWGDGGTAFRAIPPRFEFFAEPGHVPVGTAELRPAPPERAYWVSKLDLSFLDRLAGSRAIRVEADGDQPVELPLADPAATVAELRSCNDSALRAFGVDPAALAAIRRLPKPLGGGASAWLSPADYPQRAARERRGGMPLALLTVGADGRVHKCRVVRASGSQDLDSTTCILLKHRGRYEPALGPDGAPVSAPVFVNAIWNTG
jgi:TonB family protein